ncbi:MAG: amidohydrolase family protein [Lentisphaerae bacterium]|nr:amidohydrolase family protein [Lentisphaerota bacterium]
MSASIAICGSRIYDGSGSQPYFGDVVLEDNLIRKISPPGQLNLTGVEKIDGRGLCLAPGFIDAHGHSDLPLVQYPRADSRISQGVTTEVCGNCGFSKTIASTKLEDGCQWTDLASYAEVLNRRQPAINLVALVGHSTLRTMVIGDQDVPAKPADIEAMQKILARALQQGAAGFSSGLWYIPGKFADTAEVAALNSVLKGTRKPYATHLRDEQGEVVAAIEEAKTIARAGSGILQISHLKTLGQPYWHLLDRILDSIEAGRREGLKITADRYPYLYNGTSLRMVLPPPLDRIPDIKAFLQNQDNLQETIATLQALQLDWDGIVVADTGEERDHDIRGRSIKDIAALWGQTPEQACCELMLRTYTFGLFRTMCQENLERICRQEWVCAGSDGEVANFNDQGRRRHPRAFGTFPRFFRTLIQAGCQPQEAIRKMTALPAAVFNLRNRGLIKEKAIADLVLFNEDKLDAKMDFLNPHQPAQGIERVIVAGKTAFLAENPEFRGNNGKFLQVL